MRACAATAARGAHIAGALITVLFKQPCLFVVLPQRALCWIGGWGIIQGTSMATVPFTKSHTSSGREP